MHSEDPTEPTTTTKNVVVNINLTLYQRIIYILREFEYMFTLKMFLIQSFCEIGDMPEKINSERN